MTAAELLGTVLQGARMTVGRSPEQVAEQTGVHGSTIRRLEEGGSERPRRTTLQELARFYGMDVDFLIRLASWSSRGVGESMLQRRVMELAAHELGQEAIDALPGYDDERLVAVAMRLARSRPTKQAVFSTFGSGKSNVAANLAAGEAIAALRGRPGLADAEHDELARALEDLATLDRRRRAMALALIRELHRAQLADRMIHGRVPRSSTPGRLFDEPVTPGQQSLPLAGEPDDG